MVQLVVAVVSSLHTLFAFCAWECSVQVTTPVGCENRAFSLASAAVAVHLLGGPRESSTRWSSVVRHANRRSIPDGILCWTLDKT
eukprot:3802261-Amphidinium_carterae.1